MRNGSVSRMVVFNHRKLTLKVIEPNCNFGVVGFNFNKGISQNNFHYFFIAPGRLFRRAAVIEWALHWSPSEQYWFNPCWGKIIPFTSNCKRVLGHSLHENLTLTMTFPLNTQKKGSCGSTAASRPGGLSLFPHRCEFEKLIRAFSPT